MVAYAGMGDEMIIDLGTAAGGPVPNGACGAPQAYATQTHSKPIARPKIRYFLAIWAMLSVAWISAAVYNIYQRVDEQADMSMDVEHDLDQGLTTVACAGKCLAGVQESPAFSRFEIASTFFRFGSVEMGECVFGPPVALLLIGLGALSVLRRRRRTI
jgi:uncharacterized protein (TIGR03382 family)